MGLPENMPKDGSVGKVFPEYNCAMVFAGTSVVTLLGSPNSFSHSGF